MEFREKTSDSTPKWFTQVDLDLRDRWTESTIQPAPAVNLDDAAFTRVVITAVPDDVTPFATPGA